MITREEAEALTATIQSIDPDDHINGYFAQLAQSLRDDGVELPRVTIEWRNLKSVVQATTSQASLPSLPNVLLLIGKKLTFQRPKTEPLTILNDLSGVLQPGKFTLLLAPPSTGKTTFLRALAGRLPASSYTGDITYNGHRATEFSPERSITYVAQFDTHIPNLTARETVQFAYDIQHSPAGSTFKYAPPAPTSKAGVDAPLRSVATGGATPSLKGMTAADLADLTRAAFDGPGRVDALMGIFGLARAKDTNVGNRMFRGISGGERKRLSTVELLAGPQRVLVLDEVSTGLDAATLFDVARWLRAMTHHLEMTVIVSLLQPPPETFALFDDLMLMNEGTVVYHGALRGALPYVQSLGFAIPPRKDLPSFLQEVTTVRGQIAYAGPALRAARGAPPSLAAVDDIELSQRDLIIPLPEMAAAGPPAAAPPAAKASGPGGGALVPLSERYPLPPLAMLRLVLARQAKLFVRDVTLVRARIGQCVLMGLLIGGLWFQRDNTLDDSRTVLAAIFMIVMFLGFGGLPQLAVALQNRSVWFKHREANLYTASAYAWSMSLVQMPMSLVEALVFSSIIYFMVGFSTDSARYFFIFCAVLASASLAITSIFRMVGSFFASPAIANAAAGFMLLMLVVNSGFVIVRNAIEPWVIWFYYLSPFAYSIRALAINEMTSPRWAAVAPFSGKSTGVTALETFDFFTEEKWIWIGIAFNLGFFVLTTQISALALDLMPAPQRMPIITRKEDVTHALQAARKIREEAHAMLAGAGPPGTNGRPLAGSQTVPAADSKPAAEPARVSGEARRSRRSMDSVHNMLEVGSTLKFTPITVCWKAINYYVPVPKGLTGAAALNIMPDDAAEDVRGKKRLLHNITGYAEPGVLTALMGGSGAGKTTLMDVLAGRKTQGVQHGELTVNGHAKAQETWARVVGYVEQTDVHSGGLTVEESLQFSAGLRLAADVAAATREAYVLEVMLVANLLDIKGNLVGEPGESGLSVEQRRRLSIAVELVANPSVIFLDEPTSGLDAQSAAAVMDATRNVAENNRTVMVTIHQPSIEIFESFDRLVLLGMGGELIYFGDVGQHSGDLVRYFEGISGVPPLPEGYNPATWMLEVSGGGAKMHIEAVDLDFAALYRGSALCAEAGRTVDRLVAERAACTAPLALATRYAVPFAQQTKMVVWKQAIVYWRYPNYTVGRLVVATITALLAGITWWGEGSLPDGPAEVSNINNLIGSLYASLAFMGMTNLIGGLPAFFSERQVMYRERAASMYAVLPFGIATGVVELPYLLTQALIFVPISYFMIGFRAAAEPLILYIIIFTESIALYTFMGQFFTYLTPTAPVATVLGGLCHFLWTLFSGFLITQPAMAKGFVWLYYLSGTAYVLYGNAAAQLGNEERKAIIPGQNSACSRDNLDACPSVGQFMEDFFGFEYGFRWWCVLILLVFIMFFRVAAMVVLKLVNHQRR